MFKRQVFESLRGLSKRMFKSCIEQHGYKRHMVEVNELKSSKAKKRRWLVIEPGPRAVTKGLRGLEIMLAHIRGLGSYYVCLSECVCACVSASVYASVRVMEVEIKISQLFGVLKGHECIAVFYNFIALK